MRRSLLGMCGSFLASLGCAGQPAAPTLAHPAASPALPTCEKLAGADAVLDRAPVTLLGEMHGTAEFPAFVATLACHAERKGKVIVALELPHDMQPALDAFARDPSEQHARALFEQEMWTKDYQDGRTSVAMKQLIETLAQRSAQSAGRVSLLAIDEPSQPDERDRAMAMHTLTAHRSAPDARIIVLTGNLHNRLTIGVPWDEHYRPMGYQLRELGVNVVSLHGTYAPGTSWSCDSGEVSSCGVKPLESPEPAGAPSISLEKPCADGACDGSFHVGRPSASFPAQRAGA